MKEIAAEGVVPTLIREREELLMPFKHVSMDIRREN